MTEGLVRDVHRAGWLKFIPFPSDHDQASIHRFWVVFAVHDDRTPLLEFYQQRQMATPTAEQPSRTAPVSVHDLKKCRSVAIAIGKDEEFTVTLKGTVIRLAADNRQSTLDWVDTIRNKLIQLKVLSDNLYSKGPESGGRPVAVTRPMPIPRRTAAAQRPLPALPPEPENDGGDQSVYEPIFAISPLTFNAVANNGQGNGSSSDEAPPPYQSVVGQQPLPAAMSLRESQVMKLLKEMNHEAGVRLMIRKKDAHNTLALIDFDGECFIAGWKQKTHPMLHGHFHLADRLLSVSGQPVHTSTEANTLIRSQLSDPATSTIELIVSRIPLGRVYFLKRDADGQELGLVRDPKQPAIIKHILSGSLAERFGMMVIGGGDFWRLTEINNRPLNLWFKGQEIDDRLKSIGKEISLVVQPNRLVKAMKKQLKAMRSFKDFVLQ